MGGIGLGGGHGNFRPRPGIQNVVRVPGDGGSHHVDDGQRPSAPALGLPHGGHGVQRLAGLADNHHQRALIHQRIAVPKFAGQHHLHRTAQQLFPDIFAHHAHMVAGAAGNYEDAGYILRILPGQLHIVQHNPALPDTGGDGAANSVRLLHNLLEHEVGVATLFSGRNVPVHGAAGFFHRDKLTVKHVDAPGRHHRDFPVVHIGHVPGVFNHCRHVGGNKIAVLAIAQDQRTVLPGGNQRIRIVGADDAEGIGTLNTPQDAAHGLQHVVAFVVVKLQ
ncbi:hypothetical protein SDC9_128891 [bioreactor metagenome]|uniref:Uncharacterized protein n=1 Tax=bioreactor metagenome TaxID=1076179 RepID=A0A645CY06_9ZZZZ